MYNLFVWTLETGRKASLWWKWPYKREATVQTIPIVKYIMKKKTTVPFRVDKSVKCWNISSVKWGKIGANVRTTTSKIWYCTNWLERRSNDVFSEQYNLRKKIQWKKFSYFWHKKKNFHCDDLSNDAIKGIGLLVFNTTFNDISAILCLSVLLVEETRVTGKTTDLMQVADKSYRIRFYQVHLVKRKNLSHKLQKMYSGDRYWLYR